MLFNPEDGKTIEECIEIAWNNSVSPSLRARVLALVEKTGRTQNTAGRHETDNPGAHADRTQLTDHRARGMAGIGS